MVQLLYRFGVKSLILVTKSIFVQKNKFKMNNIALIKQ